MFEGHEVIVVDNFFTGRKKNVESWIGHENFELIHHDIVNPLFIEVDEIYHLASPASPPHYMQNPVKTVKTNAVGTINMLGELIPPIPKFHITFKSFRLSPESKCQDINC